LSSWPDLFRPSTPLMAQAEGVEGRDKPGHDDITEAVDH
jgi:hypothetical protein